MRRVRRDFWWIIALWACLSVVRGAGWHDPMEYEAEIRQFEEADRRTPPPANPILFTGSSTIRAWLSLTNDFSDLPVINRGFGGSHYSDLVHFYPRLIPPYRPGMILLYSGDNDLGSGLGVGDVFTELTNLVARIRTDLPGTFVGIISVKPSPARLGVLAKQHDFNDRIRKFCADQPQLRFIDLVPAMLDQTGQPKPELFGPDRLHMNPAGYALWTDLIRAELGRWGPYRPKRFSVFPAVAGAALAGGVAMVVWLRRQWSQPRPSK